MRTVLDERQVPRGRLGGVGLSFTRIASLLTVLVAVAIATGGFLYGNQLVFGDASEYFELAQVMTNRGFGTYGSELRTYGYPAFLAAIMRVAGQELDDVRAVVFAVQLALLLWAAWFVSRRLQGALGIAGIGQAIFVVTAVNPFLLLHAQQLLTDMPAAILLYLAVGLSLPQRRPEAARRVLLLVASALFCTGLAVMLRPSHLAATPVIVGIWVVRAFLYRDVPWSVLPVALLALALPFVPQMWSNQRNFGVMNPLIVRSLYAEQSTWGIQYLKYATLVVPGYPNTLFYDNPFKPDGDLSVGRVLREYPGAYLATLAVHVFAMADQDFPLTYIRDVDPWYRWPLSVLNYLFWLGVPIGLVLGLRGTGQQATEDRHRQRFAVLALGVTAAALVAIYLPTAVENRFSLPLYLLLATPFVLAARRVYAALPTLPPSWMALGGLAIVAWVGAASAASVWVQRQAPLLQEVREVKAGLRPASRREEAAASQSARAPGPTAIPAREVPVARYDGELPKELRVRRTTEFNVTVMNMGHEIWNVGGSYPVNVAARFVARTTELPRKSRA